MVQDLKSVEKYAQESKSNRLNVIKAGIFALSFIKIFFFFWSDLLG